MERKNPNKHNKTNRKSTHNKPHPQQKTTPMYLNNTDILCISQHFFGQHRNILLRRHSLKGTCISLPLLFNVKRYLHDSSFVAEFMCSYSFSVMTVCKCTKATLEPKMITPVVF